MELVFSLWDTDKYSFTIRIALFREMIYLYLFLKICYGERRDEIIPLQNHAVNNIYNMLSSQLFFENRSCIHNFDAFLYRICIPAVGCTF